MIETVAKKIAFYLYNSSIIEYQDVDIYSYGSEIILARLINTILIMMLACALQRPLEAIIYLAVTRPIRTFGGGWHAKTHLACATLQCSTLVITSIINIIFRLYLNLSIICVLIIIMFMVILIKAPVVHPGNPINDERQFVMKQNCLFYFLIISTTIIISYLLKNISLSSFILLSSLSTIFTFFIPVKIK